MILLIDGYNLLKQVFNRVNGKLDRQRQQLVRELGFYKHKKQESRTEIIIVFDGGMFNHATREIKNGIVIIFSGQKQSADDWIFNYVEKHKNREFLLVSMDRELKDNVKKYGVDSIDVFEFYKILQNCLQDDVEKFFKKEAGDSELKKHEHDKAFGVEEFEQAKNSEALDLLMIEASLSYPDFEKKDDYKNYVLKQKGQSKKLSKKEKNYLSKIKKL